MSGRLVRRGLALAGALAAAACARGEEARDTTPAQRAPGAAETARAAAAPDGAPACGLASVGDSAVKTHEVNRGSHGMIARTRWLASPDGCALLVMEDPAAVEAEPVLNGGMLLREGADGALALRFDGVWDAAPDSAWRRLALGRGWIVQSGESEDIPAAKWAAVARATGLPLDSVRAASFAASGMSYARGAAYTFEQEIGRGTKPRLRGPGGWRVRWRGDTLLAGTAPRTVQDHVEPTAWWVLLEGRPGVDAMVTLAPPPPRWAEGPMVDIGTSLDSLERLSLGVPIEGGRVESSGGRITLHRPRAPERAVGQGAVLAATRGGRFILAMAPRSGGRDYEPKVRLVVYEVP